MIEMIFITSLAIMGLHAVTRDGQLLGFVERFWTWLRGEWLDWEEERQGLDVGEYSGTIIEGEFFEPMEKLILSEPEKFYTPKIANPLTECPTCMASIWGTVGYIALMQPAMEWASVGFWAVFVLAVAGINHIITEVIYG